jgi:uncharacterized protein
MLIDFHTHAFADKIADKAVEQLIDYYDIPTPHNGTLNELVSEASRCGTQALVLLAAATKASQVVPANQWTRQLASFSDHELRRTCGLSRVPRLIPFGTFHPGYADWKNEIDDLFRMGCRGIKLHPEFQGIDLADPRLNPFFEAVAGRMIVLVHMGDTKRSTDNFSTPKKLAKILDRFPTLTVVAAHMGGLYFWEESLEELAGRDLYFDTSSTLPFIDRELLRKLISKHGTERILFGSDYPLQSTASALADIDSLGWLTSRQKELILGENAAAFLGLSQTESPDSADSFQ